MSNLFVGMKKLRILGFLFWMIEGINRYYF
jgi:hypothetical protein